MRKKFILPLILSLVSIFGLSACTPTVDKAIDFANGKNVDVVDGNIANVDASTESINLGSQLKVSDDLKININLALNELTNLDGNNLIEQSEGNCAPYIAPQPYAFSGASAGFTKTANAIGVYEHAVQLNSLLNNFSNTKEDVAIIVVDDFAGNASSIEDFNSSKDTLEKAFNANDTKTWPVHGNVVLNHINLLLLATDYEFMGYQVLNVDGARANWSKPNSRLTVEALDFNNSKSQNIAKRLESSIQNLKDEGYNNIVVNMSFALVPCSVWNDYVAHVEQYKALEDYAQAVYGKNEAALSAKIDLSVYGNSVVLSSLIIKLTTAVNPLDDPLNKTIEQHKNVTFIASAGNFGNEFSTYPAAYPKVIAVSAMDLASNEKAAYANSGNLLIPGGSFLLEFIDNGVQKTNISYRGSSFAAPELSFISALNLASGSACNVLASGANLPLEKALNCK